MTNETPPPDTEEVLASEYVEALYREAAGYVAKNQPDRLEAVNRELAAQGAKPVKLPAAGKSAGK